MRQYTKPVTLSLIMIIAISVYAETGCLFSRVSEIFKFRKAEKGYVTFNIISDDENEELMDGLIEFIEPKRQALFVEDGNMKYELPAGKYTIKAMADQCETMTREIEILPNENIVVYFDMPRKGEPAVIKGRILDFATGEPINLAVNIPCSENICNSDEIGYFENKVEFKHCNVSASADGYFDWSMNVPIDSDTVRIDVLMLKKQSKMVLEEVKFKSGTAEFANESLKQLDRLVYMLTACPEAMIDIQGFTDDQGKAKDNLGLSEKRAEKVYNYLISKGVNEVRLTYRGFGETMNRVDNETKENREKNRRIEILVLN